MLAFISLLLIALLAPAPAATQPADADRPVTIGSKPFGESFLLAEMFARLLEERGYAVRRRPGLGETEIAFSALRRGDVDVYPEYTGVGLLVILDEEAPGNAAETFGRVSREFDRRFGVRWLPPLGFENTYAMSVRRGTADSLNLATLSDLAEVAPGLTAGFSPDFIGREDGLPGLREAYGLAPGSVRALLQAVKYQALAAGEVDVIDGYSTDGFIARYELVVLEDDRGFFPPYEAAALVGPRLREEQPGAVAVLTELSGRMDEATMQRLNEALEVDGQPVARVAEVALAELGLLDDAAEIAPLGRRGERGSLAAYLWAQRGDLGQLTLRHLLLVGVSMALAVLLAVPLGVLLERVRRSAETAIRGVGLLQTIPSIALLAFMIPLLGIGVVPAIVALFLYSLFPILRNTYSGIRDADPEAVNAARALGMTPLQVLRLVRLPLAAPTIMAGVRTAAVINVGTATLAAFIGAGGLGDPIVAGLALSDTRMILSGAIPAAALAFVVDALLGLCERGLTPRGVAGG